MTRRTPLAAFTHSALIVGALALALLAGGCGGRASSQSAPADDSAQKTAVEYKLQANDELSIAVFGQKDLSGKFAIDSDGNLMLPLVGQLAAVGQTAPQVQDALTEALKAFLVNPRVTVQVASFRPFYILGEVNKPGSYPYSPGITVRQGVATAGGYTKRARTGTVEVFHSGQTDKDATEATEDYQLQPGDTVQVEKRLF
jgi:protein involved in polysaccharide export with SLBB domain